MLTDGQNIPGKVKCTLVQALRLCTGRTAHRGSRGIHSLVFSPQAGFSRNQNPVRRLVWLWHTACWAYSQGQVAIAFPRLQTFPPSPLGAFTSNDARDLQQRKVELFVGDKCSDKFRLEFDFHVILEIFYMPQICDMGPTALLPLRRKAF